MIIIRNSSKKVVKKFHSFTPPICLEAAHPRKHAPMRTMNLKGGLRMRMIRINEISEWEGFQREDLADAMLNMFDATSLLSASEPPSGWPYL